MKVIELAIYTPDGQIKIDTGVYKTNIDKRLSLDKLITEATDKVIGVGICADYGTVCYMGHWCQIAGFRIVDIQCSVFHKNPKPLTDFIPVETSSVARLKERFANGEFPDLNFGDCLTVKIQ